MHRSLGFCVFFFFLRKNVHMHIVWVSDTQKWWTKIKRRKISSERNERHKSVKTRAKCAQQKLFGYYLFSWYEYSSSMNTFVWQLDYFLLFSPHIHSFPYAYIHRDMQKREREFQNAKLCKLIFHTLIFTFFFSIFFSLSNN